MGEYIAEFIKGGGRGEVGEGGWEGLVKIKGNMKSHKEGLLNCMGGIRKVKE